MIEADNQYDLSYYLESVEPVPGNNQFRWILALDANIADLEVINKKGFIYAGVGR
jgi:hypothetical protein